MTFASGGRRSIQAELRAPGGTRSYIHSWTSTTIYTRRARTSRGMRWLSPVLRKPDEYRPLSDRSDAAPWSKGKSHVVSEAQPYRLAKQTRSGVDARPPRGLSGLDGRRADGV